MSVQQVIDQMGQQALQAARQMRAVSTRHKNDALRWSADEIMRDVDAILSANAKDMQQAGKEGLSDSLRERLEPNATRVEGVAEGLHQIAALPDPVGEITDLVKRPSGIRVGKMRVSLGVVAIIYESRPGVTADAAGLCLKSGNAVLLRGGSEALNSNLAIAKCLYAGISKASLPEHVVQVFDTTDRAAVGALLKAEDYVDVIIPRGGPGLIKRVAEESTIPVIKHLDGICHVYVDKDADMAMALAISVNAKAQRYGVCNAMETLLVHTDVAQAFLPAVIKAMEEQGVEVRGCEKTCATAPAKKASEEDWRTEYLGPVVSIRVVDSIDAAMEHIAEYGSSHTESIVTENYTASMRFLAEVDSSSVMINASTRFADGFEYGLGAEIGISTDRLHARGPVGLEGLTTQKWVVFGQGEIRS